MKCLQNRPSTFDKVKKINYRTGRIFFIIIFMLALYVELEARKYEF